METFAPVLALGPLPRGCVQIGEWQDGSPSAADDPEGLIASWSTKAAFHAGCAATGCRSAYALEAKFGPCRRQPNESSADWGNRRQRMWDRWQRGGSVISDLRERASPGLDARLRAVREVSPLVDDVLASEFWRYLDPRPLTTDEVVPLSRTIERYAMHRFMQPTFRFHAAAEEAKMLLSGLRQTDTRYQAMAGIWLRMRSSYSLEAIGRYALSFLCWLAARPALESDPVFGPFIAEIYAYTIHHYSRLSIWPADARTFESAVGELNYMRLMPTSSPESLQASVKLSDLATLMDKGSSKIYGKSATRFPKPSSGRSY
jgi:hypothetical protein